MGVRQHCRPPAPCFWVAVGRLEQLEERVSTPLGQRLAQGTAIDGSRRELTIDLKHRSKVRHKPGSRLARCSCGRGGFCEGLLQLFAIGPDCPFLGRCHRPLSRRSALRRAFRNGLMSPGLHEMPLLDGQRFPPTSRYQRRMSMSVCPLKSRTITRTNSRFVASHSPTTMSLVGAPAGVNDVAFFFFPMAVIELPYSLLSRAPSIWFAELVVPVTVMPNTSATNRACTALGALAQTVVFENVCHDSRSRLITRTP